MRPYIRSLGYALSGLWHAFTTERNLKLFLAFYILSLIIAEILSTTRLEWAIVIFTGGTFLAFELLNTSLEHFSDAFRDHTRSHDDSHDSAVKATKDIAAGASLLSLIAWGITLSFVYWPHLLQLMR